MVGVGTGELVQEESGSPSDICGSCDSPNNK